MKSHASVPHLSDLGLKTISIEKPTHAGAAHKRMFAGYGDLSGYRINQDLKRFLSIFSDRIFDSSVDLAIPSLAAAPDGPNTRP
jgi:hypothetical protein